jgi:type III pantothenate kinase
MTRMGTDNSFLSVRIRVIRGQFSFRRQLLHRLLPGAYSSLMDINLMTLNVGTSRLAVGVFAAGELIHTARIPHTERERWPAIINEAWAKIIDSEDPAIAGVSVNPAVMESLEHSVEQLTGHKVEWVGREIDLPIRVLTDPPAETGVDRVVTIAAAYEQLGKACVVVDAGSAITVNCCNDQGDFLGGAIAPGVRMMLDALHEKTASLPKIDLTIPKAVFGRSTVEAIRHGVFFGIRGMVKELIENYATELGSWPEMIATGGDAALLFEGWELVHAISPDLTLYGIALAYANHYIKHDSQ